MTGDRFDYALRLHEAAHAVTAEILRPGCVEGIQMDYVPGSPALFTGEVFGGDVAAMCCWKRWRYDDPGHQIATAAGREGEKIAGYPDRLDGGDRWILRLTTDALQRRTARRRAAAIVRKHEAAVRRVARALASSRVMTGDEIRAEIARFA